MWGEGSVGNGSTVACWCPQGHPSCFPGRETPEVTGVKHLPVPPPPPPVALPALSEKWPPLSFLAFPRAPGRTLPKPPTPGGWAVASAVEKPDTKVPRAQGVGWRALPPHCPLGLCTLRSSTWGVFKDALVTSSGCPDKLRDAPENYPGTPGPRCFRLAVESGVALGSRASSSG